MSEGVKYELYGTGKFRQVSDQQIADHQMKQVFITDMCGKILVFGSSAQAEAYSIGTGGARISIVWVRPTETVI